MAAGVLPEVAVRLVGDIRDLQAKLATARGDLETTARAGGSSLDKLAAAGKGILLGVGAALASVGAIAIKQAADQESANAALRTSIENAGGSWQQYAKQIDEAEASGRKLGFADDEAARSLATLTQATQSPSVAIKDLGLAMDLARGRNIDLASATAILAKVETGHVALLSRYGINIKDATGATISQEEALRRLAAVYGGSAAADAQTFAGKIRALKEQGMQLAEQLGGVLIPVVLKLGGATVAGVHWLEEHRLAAAALGLVIGGPLVAAMVAYIAVQTRAFAVTALSGAQQAVVLFGRLGAAIRGTTLAEVAFTESAAAQAGTVALGIGATAGLAAAVGLLATTFIGAKKTGDDYAKSIALAGGATVAAQVDALRAKLAELDAQLKGHVLNLGPVHITTDLLGNKYTTLAKDADGVRRAISELTGSNTAFSASAGGAAGAAQTEADKVDAAAQSVKSLQSALIADIDAQRAWRQSTQSVTDARQSLADKQRALSDLQHKAVVDAKAVAQADKQVESTTRSLTSARKALVDAETALDALDHPSERTQAEAKLALSEAWDQQNRSVLAVSDAQAALSKAQNDGQVSDEDRQKAALDLQDAMNSAARASYSYKDADAAVQALTPGGIRQSDAYKSALDNVVTAKQAVKDASDAQREALDQLAIAQLGDTARSTELAAASRDVESAKRSLEDATWNEQVAAWKSQEAHTAETEAISGDADAVATLRGQLEALGNSPSARYGAAILGQLGSAGVPELGVKVGTPGVRQNADAAAALYPGRALGGHAMAGQGYWVGENGPEPFFPRTSGTILPAGSGAGSVVHIENVHVMAGGLDFTSSSDRKRAAKAFAEDVRDALNESGSQRSYQLATRPR